MYASEALRDFYLQRSLRNLIMLLRRASNANAIKTDPYKQSCLRRSSRVPFSERENAVMHYL